MKKVVDSLNFIEYGAFVLATIFVIVFQFTALPIFVVLSLSIYTLAFLIVFVIAVIQCKEYFDKTRGVKIETTKEKTTKDGDEIVDIKSEKAWAIIKAIASGIFAIFTIVVLILY